MDDEITMVGAGEGITNTKELKVMTTELKVMSFDEAMAQAEKDTWVKSVDEEHQRMVDCKVWLKKEDLPENCDIIDSTWSMKKKASGKYYARLAARGFKQRKGVSYYRDDLFAPVRCIGHSLLTESNAYNGVVDVVYSYEEADNQDDIATMECLDEAPFDGNYFNCGHGQPLSIFHLVYLQLNRPVTLVPALLTSTFVHLQRGKWETQLVIMLSTRYALPSNPKA